MIEIFILCFAFLFLLLASIHDFKTREVPDFLSYIGISFAILIKAFQLSINFSWLSLIWTISSFLLLTTFSYLMYISGQWGGGDVKVMAGISILLSNFSFDSFFPFFLNFFINILVAGAVYGLIMTIYVGIKNFKKIKKKIKLEDYIIFAITFIAIALVILFSPKIMIAPIIVIILLLGSLKFVKLVEEDCMEKYVKPSELTEGDWIVNDIKVGKRVIVPKRNIGLTIDDLKKIKKLKIKRVKIKIGFPFVPAFLLAFVFTILFGNVIFLLF